MRSEISGSPSFGHVHVDLSQNESIVAEAGAMISMAPEVSIRVTTNGGFFPALVKKLLGGESFFVNRFTNRDPRPRRVTLAPPLPGEVASLDLAPGEAICLERGAYLASTEEVRLGVAWAGFASLVAGHGLVWLKAVGPGRVFWYAYGGIIRREVDGTLKVDDGHLVAYDPALTLRLGLAGGLFASVAGGEGIVLRLTGRGRAFVQSRSVKALAGWLNPKFR